MKFRFAHLADVHLGYAQYGLKERFDDFGRAWLNAVQQCMDADVKFAVGCRIKRTSQASSRLWSSGCCRSQS